MTHLSIDFCIEQWHLTGCLPSAYFSPILNAMNRSVNGKEQRKCQGNFEMFRLYIYIQTDYLLCLIFTFNFKNYIQYQNLHNKHAKVCKNKARNWCSQKFLMPHIKQLMSFLLLYNALYSGESAWRNIQISLLSNSFYLL